MPHLRFIKRLKVETSLGSVSFVGAGVPDGPSSVFVGAGVPDGPFYPLYHSGIKENRRPRTSLNIYGTSFYIL